MTSAHTTETPTNGDENNVNPLTTGGKIMFAQAGFILGLRFWVPATNSGTYTVGFYEVTADDVPIGTGTGTLLASAAVAAAAVTAGAWAEVAITPVAVSPGVVYLTARHSTSGRYVFSAGVFTAASISNGGLTLIQDGQNPNPPNLGVMRNMMFNEGAVLTYPTNQFGQPDYFSDVNFSLTVPVTGGAHTHGHTKNRSSIPMMDLAAA